MITERRMRNALLFISTLVLTTFALPSAALDKLYKYAVYGCDAAFTSCAPLTVLPGATTTHVKITFTNVSTGNSNIKSLAVTRPGSSVTISNARTGVSYGSIPASQCTFTGSDPDSTHCVAFTGFSPVPPSGFIDVVFDAINGGDDIRCSWPTNAWTGVAQGGQPFNLSDSSQSAGWCSANCGASLTSLGSGVTDAFHGLFNKDGSACLATNYKLDATHLSDPTAPYVSLLWDQTAQPYASFILHITSQPRPANPATGWGTTPIISWDTDANGNNINKVYAVACVDSRLPAPYGTVATSPVSATATTITVDTNGAVEPDGSTPLVLPSAFPFPIVVQSVAPNKPERMTVTGKSLVSGSIYTLNVTRGLYGQTPVDHPIGMKVNRTPMPIDPNQKLAVANPGGSTTNPYYGKPDEGCVTDYSWTFSGLDSNGNQLLILEATFVVNGDVVMSW